MVSRSCSCVSSWVAVSLGSRYDVILVVVDVVMLFFSFRMESDSVCGGVENLISGITMVLGCNGGSETHRVC